MSDFVRSPMFYIDKKNFLCVSCAKIYKWKFEQYSKNGGKCPKCGGALEDLDLKKYTDHGVHNV